VRKCERQEAMNSLLKRNIGSSRIFAMLDCSHVIAAPRTANICHNQPCAHT